MTFNDIIDRMGVKPYYRDEQADIVIYCADCRNVLPLIRGVSAVVTDPPYGLGFMGREWDTFDKSQFGRKGSEGENDLKVKKNFNILPRYQSEGLYQFVLEWASLCLSVVQHGAMMLSFGGTRTSHRIAVAIEDAGWEIRDTLMWVYGSGFPKSHNVAGAIDKKLGYGDRGHRIATANRYHPDGTLEPNGELLPPYEAKSPEAKLWDGYGTALKPAYEPITLAMKPIEGTFANNALKHGVAGLNIDECRIPAEDKPSAGKRTATFGTQETISGGDGSGGWEANQKGRFPANFIHDGSDEVLGLFPNSNGAFAPVKSGQRGFGGVIYGKYKQAGDDGKTFYNDGLSSAARFFYCAKASRAERDAGLDIEPQRIEGRDKGQDERNVPYKNRPEPQRNQHPTVKPLALMTYLVKLVKMPEYNLILDPFCGSGSTLLACRKLGIRSIGIDSDEKSCEIAAKRLSQSVMPLNI